MACADGDFDRALKYLSKGADPHFKVYGYGKDGNEDIWTAMRFIYGKTHEHSPEVSSNDARIKLKKGNQGTMQGRNSFRGVRLLHLRAPLRKIQPAADAPEDLMQVPHKLHAGGRCLLGIFRPQRGVSDRSIINLAGTSPSDQGTCGETRRTNRCRPCNNESPGNKSLPGTFSRSKSTEAWRHGVAEDVSLLSKLKDSQYCTTHLKYTD